MTVKDELLYVLNTKLNSLIEYVDKFNNSTFSNSVEKLGKLYDCDIPLYYRICKSSRKSVIKGVSKYAFVTLRDLHINGKENKQLYNSLIELCNEGLNIGNYTMTLTKDHNFYGTTRSILAFIKNSVIKNISYNIVLDQYMLADISENCSATTIKKVLSQL